MSPDEALEYGLIDHIITGHRGQDQAAGDEGPAATSHEPEIVDTVAVPAAEKSSPVR
jgi:hypothetical protein